ncbi:hypothetical protein OKW41_002699 [Paraburkholderia sp. UCT70]|uniref:hypothetical protein n=1 Tax=Paraburkholderia sp. UCT70 TaxID=2991068 RepID=UPI003D1B131B
MEEILPNQTETGGLTYSEEQADIFERWVHYFGATDPQELDLGMLMAIHEWVMDGLEPRDQRQER